MSDAVKRKKIELSEIRRAVADYIYSEGCSCCCREEEHGDAAGVLAKLLKVPRYGDKSGYDFYRFRTKREAGR